MYQLESLKSAILFNSQEIIPSHDQLDEELAILVNQANATGEYINHYIGFEISGQIHIGTGIASALKIKKFTDAGVNCHIFLADYHTWLNSKLDGTIQTARAVAMQYFGPVMLECCKVVGCNMDLVSVVYAQSLYQSTKNDKTIWDFDLKVAKNLTLSRVLKSVSVTGKAAGEHVEFAILRYPCLQVADAFFMGTHIVHAGMDQRKCHVLMREVAPKLDEGFELKIGSTKVKPIAIHHTLLLSLLPPATDGLAQERMREEVYEDNKMSKSKPESAVFVHDSSEDIERKIKKAYCPIIDRAKTAEENEAIQAFNPLLNWSKNMIYPAGKILEVVRPDKFGGNKTYPDFASLEADYMAGNLHPLDFKNALSKSLIEWFVPIRAFVESNPEGLDLLKSVKK